MTMTPFHNSEVQNLFISLAERVVFKHITTAAEAYTELALLRSLATEALGAYDAVAERCECDECAEQTYTRQQERVQQYP